MCAPLMIACALGGANTLLLYLVLWGFVSDVLDGRVARATRGATARGARLDSSADLCFYVALALAVLSRSPTVPREEWPLIGVAMVTYMIPILIGWLKFGQLTSYHTYLDRAASAAMAVAAFVWLAFDSTGALPLGVFVLVLSSLDEILITVLLPSPRHNVAHVFTAFLLHSPTAMENRISSAPLRIASSIVSVFAPHVRRWSRRIVALLLSCIAFGSLSSRADAQWRVGGFIGGEHESSWDEFLVIGADARGPLGARSLEINPRLSYFLRDGTTRVQADLNLIKPLVLASQSRLAPYVGLGLAVESVSYDGDQLEDETSVGFNYIVGSTVKTQGRLAPFAQFQYTVLNEAPNNAVVSLGLHIKLGGSVSRITAPPGRR